MRLSMNYVVFVHSVLGVVFAWLERSVFLVPGNPTLDGYNSISKTVYVESVKPRWSSW